MKKRDAVEPGEEVEQHEPALLVPACPRSPGLARVEQVERAFGVRLRLDRLIEERDDRGREMRERGGIRTGAAALPVRAAGMSHVVVCELVAERETHDLVEEIASARDATRID